MLSVRAKEEGLEFGLEVTRQFCILKCNNGFQRTMMLFPSLGLTIVDGILKRDYWWQEKVFVFKVNHAFVRDLDFGESLENGRKR